MSLVPLSPSGNDLTNEERATLANLLSQPVLRKALAIARYIQTPISYGGQPIGADEAAANFYRAEGADAVVKSLEFLSTPLTEKVSPPIDSEWDHFDN